MSTPSYGGRYAQSAGETSSRAVWAREATARRAHASQAVIGTTRTPARPARGRVSSQRRNLILPGYCLLALRRRSKMISKAPTGPDTDCGGLRGISDNPRTGRSACSHLQGQHSCQQRRVGGLSRAGDRARSSVPRRRAAADFGHIRRQKATRVRLKGHPCAAKSRRAGPVIATLVS
jgi:hypothetical protein